ncbi:DUF4249 domain-containing protein [Maribacter sp. 2308TA10-17]|uniref:DUF4249 domain-containing protein n=1 Tax=Maribacter sp. 2308TA10-17 TaxID=3386276 RepID=UPI0039BD596C
MYKFLILTFVFCVLGSCIEPFEFQTETETFEDALVIEASLTNEMKQHKVKLSRALRFEDLTSTPERNARVIIIDDSQNEIVFQETEEGIYLSDPFAAQKGIKYSLVVETNDGTVYRSDPESFESESEIQEVFANRETNDEGEDGIFVYTDSFDSSGDSQYYRYEYEETYKIIAPNWTPLDFQLTNYEPCNPDFSSTAILYDLEIVRRDQEEQTCYNTISSNDIIQTSSAGLSDSKIERFPVRFIPASDFILTHRYSILVKQYVQSTDAFSYYQSLENFSSSTSVFSEIQPGFLEGNISAENDSDKKVLGYFEVASVSEKRIFFGFRDFYPEAPFPLYIKNCVPFSTPLEHISYCYNGPASGNTCPESLIERMARNSITYVSVNDGTVGLTCPGEYVVVERECGDCTALGSNIVPDFWIE